MIRKIDPYVQIAGPLQKFKDFPGKESKFSNTRTFQVFRDLCKPCLNMVAAPKTNGHGVTP